MGDYISIRGWIECFEDKIPEIKAIIASFVDNSNSAVLSPDTAEFYNRGWVFPDNIVNTTSFIFYGADIRSRHMNYLKNQIIRLSSDVIQIDGEFINYLYGIFHICNEENKELYIWKLADGKFRETKL